MARNTPAPIQQFRGTAAKLDAYTGPVGELTVDTTDNTLRVQDGSTVGGNPIVNTTTAQTIAGSKTFATSPKVPTASADDNSQKWASTEYVKNAVDNIDPTTLDVATKDSHGVVQVGNGLYVNTAGVVGVGSITRPEVTSPTGVVLPNSGITVIASVFDSSPSDTHVKTDYKITADITGENIIAQFSGNGANLTQHFFSSSDLNSMVTGQTYYIFVRFHGLLLGESDWSAPSVVQAISGQVTPTGRAVYRHSSNKGSVIIYDEFGTTKSLFVADAAYRGTAKWRNTAAAVSGLKQWNHWYAPTCTGNVLDITTGYVDLSTVADLTPYSAQLSDAHFQAALTATLASVIQTAKAATDLMIAAGNCPAAQFCRNQSVGIELQLPNIYQLLVMFAEGDVIDSLDPTVAANPTFALGKYGTNTYRWYLGGRNRTWSSAEYSATDACTMYYGGYTYNNGKTSTYGVAPVAEL